MADNPESIKPTGHTKIRRVPQNAVFDRAEIYAILDEALIAHFSIVDEGRPFVLPMIYGRKGDEVFVHGSVGSRMMRALAEGCRTCMTVTLVDGLVLARSLFHHSMNYRSVVALGQATLLEDSLDRMQALRVISDHVLPGRWEEARAPSESEMKKTMVVSFPLDEMSAKVRTGPPGDEPEDYALSHWAGVLPLSVTRGKPIPDARLGQGVAIPDSVLMHPRWPPA